MLARKVFRKRFEKEAYENSLITRETVIKRHTCRYLLAGPRKSSAAPQIPCSRITLFITLARTNGFRESTRRESEPD